MWTKLKIQKISLEIPYKTLKANLTLILNKKAFSLGRGILLMKAQLL